MIRLYAAICVFLAFAFFSASASAEGEPKLILQVTVDQLRADLPTRYYDRLGDGGFRYLWESGVVYRNAHHAHANTETIVGHTTLATGAHPSAHGMVGNLWFDRETGYITYNVEDANYRLLTAGADVNEDAEIDPTQRAARSEGRRPAPRRAAAGWTSPPNGWRGVCRAFDGLSGRPVRALVARV